MNATSEAKARAEITEQIISLAQDGFTPTDIEEITGIRRSTLTRCLQLNGIDYDTAHKTPIEDCMNYRVEVADMRPLDAVEYLLDLMEFMFPPDNSFPQIDALDLGLTRQQAALLNFLWVRKGTVCTKDSLHAFLCNRKTSEAEWPVPKIVDVLICRLRKALKVTSWTIHTHWGEGYRLEVGGDK